jgi:hypothetical protein
MPHPAHKGTAARLAAALVAVALSGAPSVLALHAPVEGHRCVCRAHAGERECDCAICRKSWLSAQASDENLPPCHRAAAKGALARAKGAGSRDGAPCLEGTCGNLGHPTMTVAGIEPFCLPGGAAPALAVTRETRPPLAARLHGRARAPETPPPRAA